MALTCSRLCMVSVAFSAAFSKFFSRNSSSKGSFLRRCLADLTCTGDEAMSEMVYPMSSSDG